MPLRVKAARRLVLTLNLFTCITSIVCGGVSIANRNKTHEEVTKHLIQVRELRMANCRDLLKEELILTPTAEDMYAIPTITTQFGRATVFGTAKADPQGNPDDHLACSKAVWHTADRRLLPHDILVASYALPCGTQVLLYLPRTNKYTIALVGDRGPRRTKHSATLRATDLDISTGAAKALGHNGSEPIVWAVLPK